MGGWVLSDMGRGAERLIARRYRCACSGLIFGGKLVKNESSDLDLIDGLRVVRRLASHRTTIVIIYLKLAECPCLATAS